MKQTLENYVGTQLQKYNISPDDPQKSHYQYLIATKYHLKYRIYLYDFLLKPFINTESETQTEAYKKNTVFYLKLQQQAIEALFDTKREIIKCKLSCLREPDDQIKTTPMRAKYKNEQLFLGKSYLADWLKSPAELTYQQIKNENKNTAIKYIRSCKPFEVTYNEKGLLIYKKSQKLIDSQGSQFSGEGRNEVSYVVSTSGQLYIIDSHEFPDKNIKHSSVLCGSEVLCAGMMTVSNGKIECITRKTGHYRSSRKHLVNFINMLKKRRASLEGVNIFDGFEEDESHKPIHPADIPLEEYMSQYTEWFLQQTMPFSPVRLHGKI